MDKTMYFFWGNNKMSWMRYMTFYSFRKYNPDWKIILYISPQQTTDKPWRNYVHQDFFKDSEIEDYGDLLSDLNIEIDIWKLPNELLGLNINPSSLGDFFKLHLLATEGGLYSDVDILYLRPIDDFYNIIKDKDVILLYDKWLSNGFMGSNGQNAFFWDLYQSAKKNFDPKGYQSAGVDCMYNLFPRCNNWVDTVQQKYPTLKFFNYPKNYLYPYNCEELEKYFDSSLTNVPDETVGIHWYGGHVTSQLWNQKLTHKNYKSHNITWTRLADKVLEKE